MNTAPDAELIAQVLDRLDEPDAPVVELRDQYNRPEYEAEWKRDPDGPRWYRAFARLLNAAGHPASALEFARDGLKHYPDDPELMYLAVLGYARGGNLDSADDALRRLHAARRAKRHAIPPRLDMQIAAVRGRVLKDRCRRAADPDEQRRLARESAAAYLEAARLPGADTFPLINAATMSCVAGDTKTAEVLAGEALARLEGAGESPAAESDYWQKATAGEAYTLLGRHSDAAGQYKEAIRSLCHARRFGELASVVGNLQLLIRAGAGGDPEWLREEVGRQVGRVVVFSGHLIDHPNRKAEGLPPRFPHDAALIRRAEQAIRTRLDGLNARFGFCSLGCGADILFAEAMLARDAELQVVLPFARQDFVHTSVDYGIEHDWFAGWLSRFNRILSEVPPDHVHFATTERHLGTDPLYRYANEYLQGMALVRAGQLAVEPVALAVLDPTAEPAPGGTADFLSGWRALGLRAEPPIDLAELRGRVGHPVFPSGLKFPPPPPQPVGFRSIKAMLFADVKGYSAMREECTTDFFLAFNAAVARRIDEAGRERGILHWNTWGDGFFAVFDGPEACADFALAMLDRLPREIRWNDLGFEHPNPLRIGLHAGPVYDYDPDPVLRRRTFYGRHVNLTARIEPVTVPGCAFASEQFAALLAVRAPGRFRCDFVGMEKLAKEAGSAPLYRVSRA